MPTPEASHAERIVATERRALRLLTATVSGAITASTSVRDALAVRGTVAVLSIQRFVREAAAEQFQRAHDLQTTASGVIDKVSAVRAGEALARAWDRGGISQGGDTGGGGASAGWDDDAAVAAVRTTVKRVTAWEVMRAWNDEHKRDARSHPDIRWEGRWHAILDVHLCLRCRRMNGAKENGDGEFVAGRYREGWPPVHGDCRCFVEQWPVGVKR